MKNKHLGIRREKAMASHSSTLNWKIPWMEEPGGLQSMGSLRVGHDWATSILLFTFTFHFHALEKEMATHCSCLENPRDGGTCWAAVYGVAQSRTRLKRLSSSSLTRTEFQFGKVKDVLEAEDDTTVGTYLMPLNSTAKNGKNGRLMLHLFHHNTNRRTHRSLLKQKWFESIIKEGKRLVQPRETKVKWFAWDTED